MVKSDKDQFLTIVHVLQVIFSSSCILISFKFNFTHTVITVQCIDLDLLSTQSILPLVLIRKYDDTK